MYGNRFLDTLSPADAASLAAHLRRRTLARDEVVAWEDAVVENAYLPVNAVLSIVVVMRDGRQVETRTIGVEAGYGLLHALGSTRSYERVIAQIAGEAYEIPLRTLTEAAVASPSLTSHLVAFAQAALIQTAQTGACNAVHDVEQRLCRWLLTTRDRVGGDVLPLTQEHLAIMLGVQRTTVTAVASELQRRRVIAYSRGRIRITDEDAVRAIACECYEMVGLGVQDLIGLPSRIRAAV